MAEKFNSFWKKGQIFRHLCGYGEITTVRECLSTFNLLPFKLGLMATLCMSFLVVIYDFIVSYESFSSYARSND